MLRRDNRPAGLHLLTSCPAARILQASVVMRWQRTAHVAFSGETPALLRCHLTRGAAKFHTWEESSLVWSPNPSETFSLKHIHSEVVHVLRHIAVETMLPVTHSACAVLKRCECRMWKPRNGVGAESFGMKGSPPSRRSARPRPFSLCVAMAVKRRKAPLLKWISCYRNRCEELRLPVSLDET